MKAERPDSEVSKCALHVCKHPARQPTGGGLRDYREPTLTSPTPLGRRAGRGDGAPPTGTPSRLSHRFCRWQCAAGSQVRVKRDRVLWVTKVGVADVLSARAVPVPSFLRSSSSADTHISSPHKGKREPLGSSLQTSFLSWPRKLVVSRMPGSALTESASPKCGVTVGPSAWGSAPGLSQAQGHHCPAVPAVGLQTSQRQAS